MQGTASQVLKTSKEREDTASLGSWLHGETPFLFKFMSIASCYPATDGREGEGGGGPGCNTQDVL